LYRYGNVTEDLPLIWSLSVKADRHIPPHIQFSRNPFISKVGVEPLTLTPIFFLINNCSDHCISLHG
jgi:hypothetical protein